MKKPDLLYLSDMPGGPEAGTLLVTLNSLPAHGGKDIVFTEGRLRVNIFAQRYQNTIYVYENRCPHAGTPLNMFGDRFMNIEKNHLLCRTHGALFDPETGKCTGGPCKGHYLRQVAVEIRNGAIYSL
ncbi:Rieske (2Fe-2S) protein [Kordiimonas pumila]|uniref:Rieske (2Fe-2S) protein n=1 Tax=Kordiimonas pumila TaxID=2161677 RepID=A0ABV7D689_9PROT|nr:Rieske 2Fe-2S domain-containing protein [Kordiimonas pumila]